MTCSSLNGDGVDAVWDSVNEHHGILQNSGELASRRADQGEAWFWNEASELLVSSLRDEGRVAATLDDTVAAVRNGDIAATVAARRIVDAYRGSPD